MSLRPKLHKTAAIVPSSPGSLRTESSKDTGLFPGGQGKGRCGRGKEEGKEVVFFGHMLDICQEKNSGQWKEINSCLQKEVFLELIFREGPFGD